MLFRSGLLTCVCVSSLMACGHPIRDLANAAKDLIPEQAPQSTPSCPARATTRIALIANLDANSQSAPDWAAERPAATSNFSLDSSAFAADGQAVEIQIFFARRAERNWDWHVLAGEPALERGNGTLTFDGDGSLLAATTTTPLRLPRADGSLGTPVVLWLGTPKDESADGLDGVSSAPEPSQLIGYEQDGRARMEGECTDP
jgi:hypothetical protein